MSRRRRNNNRVTVNFFDLVAEQEEINEIERFEKEEQDRLEKERLEKEARKKVLDYIEEQRLEREEVERKQLEKAYREAETLYNLLSRSNKVYLSYVVRGFDVDFDGFYNFSETIEIELNLEKKNGGIYFRLPKGFPQDLDSCQRKVYNRCIDCEKLTEIDKSRGAIIEAFPCGYIPAFWEISMYLSFRDINSLAICSKEIYKYICPKDTCRICSEESRTFICESCTQDNCAEFNYNPAFLYYHRSRNEFTRQTYGFYFTGYEYNLMTFCNSRDRISGNLKIGIPLYTEHLVGVTEKDELKSLMYKVFYTISKNEIKMKRCRLGKKCRDLRVGHLANFLHTK